jgi:hypothetical protein
MGTKTASSQSTAPHSRPSARARLAYFCVGIAAEVALLAASLALDWSDSTRLSASYLLVIIYVPIATPLLFWRSMKPST